MTGPVEPRAPMRPRPVHVIACVLTLALVAGLLGAPGMLAFMVVVLVTAVVQLRRWRRWSRWEIARQCDALPSGLLIGRGPLSRADADRVAAAFDRASFDGRSVVIETSDTLPDYWMKRRHAMPRRHATALLPTETVDPLTVDPSLRDPLWSDTVAQMCADRTELVSRVHACWQRLRVWQANEQHFAGMDLSVAAERQAAQVELDAAKDELATARWLAAYPPNKFAIMNEDWAKVPRNTVVSLPRATHAACDCRFGHYSYHQIVSSKDGCAVRQCDVCSPPTRWVEVGDRDGA